MLTRSISLVAAVVVAALTPAVLHAQVAAPPRPATLQAVPRPTYDRVTLGGGFGGRALAAATTVTIISGDIQVRHGATASFVSATDGEVLVAGDTLRTGGDSRAVLTYFEGSTVSIEPNSELTIEKAAALTDGSTIVLMQQNFGRTWHVVTKLISGSSRYEVRTPSSTASVRGTIFAVDVYVDADGPGATVTTSEGVVVHSAAGPAGAASAVRVTAGQESTKSASRPADSVHAAAPATLREAPARPASAPHRTKTHAPSSDRAEVRTDGRLADPVRAVTPQKDRTASSKQKPKRAGD